MLSTQFSTMIPQSRKLFAVIVHYGPPVSTKAAVDALLGGTSVPDGIIVIDHALPEEKYTYRHDSVQVVRPDQNDGYAAGLTVGLGILLAQDTAAHDIVMCMNNDVVVDSNTVRRMRTWWEAHTQPLLAGESFGYVHLFTGRAHITGKRMPYSGYTLPYIHGSLFAAPFYVFMKIQLPEAYFLYWEDILFSQLVRRRGVSLAAIPDMRIRHTDAKNHSAQQIYYLVRNGALFLEQETPWPWRVYWRIGNRIRLMYHALRGHAVVTRALKDAIARKTGKVTV
jgi:GT2 family glycosyltransferase